MKKIFILLSLCFITFLGFASTKLKASTVGNGSYQNVEALVGLSKDELKECGFVEDVKKLEQQKYFKNGYVLFNREFRCYSTGYEFNAYLYFENSFATKYEIKLGDKILYSVEFLGNDISVNNKFRFNFLDENDNGFDSREMQMNYIGTYNGFYDSFYDIKEYLYNVGFKAVGIYSVDYQTDLYYKTKSNNPVNYLNNYLFKINDVKNINVDETNYYIIGNHIDAGRYEIIVSGTKDDKLIIQKVIINVEEGDDVIPTATPTTTVIQSTTFTTSNSTLTTTEVEANDDIKIDEYNVSYKSMISKEAYKNFLKIKYKLDAIDISSDYFDNYTRVGKYDVIISLEDKEISSSINVIDDIKPVIIGNNLSLSTNNKYSLSEFKNRLVVFDEIDGDISCKNVVMNDLDKYIDNYDKAGVYRIEAKVSDLTGNTASSIYYFYVSDKESGIFIENATIIITDSTKANIDNLISFLKKNGLISSNNAILSSSYFTTENPTGDYNLEVNENNSKDNYIIQIQDYEKAKNDIKTIDNNKENENNFNYIRIISISCAVLAILLGLGMIIYKKKH